MKTITIFCREYPPLQQGGIANTAKDLIEELKKRKDCKINLITLKYGKYIKELPTYEKVENISIYRIPIKERLFFWYETALFTWKHKKLMKNSDIIHLLNARDCPFIYTAGKTLIANINDYLPSLVPLFGKSKLVQEGKFLRYFHYNLDKLFDFISLKRANHIIFNSNFMKTYLTKYYNLRKKKKTVIYKGVDFKIFKSKKVKKDIDLLFLSNKFNLKGAKEFLRALVIVKNNNPNIKAMLIGYPSRVDINYPRFIKRLGLKDNVILKDSVPHDQVSKYYDRSKIYVFPTYSEALGQTAIESYAMKTPVIGTTVGGLPEIIGKDGILVPPKKVRPLAEAMIKLLGDDSLRKKMGLKGYQKVKNIFDNKQTIRGYFKAYEKY